MGVDADTELVDSIAERIQALGGVSLAMAADVAETTRIKWPLGVEKKFLFIGTLLAYTFEE